MRGKGGAGGGGSALGSRMEGSRASIYRDMVTLKYGAHHPLTASCIIEVGAKHKIEARSPGYVLDRPYPKHLGSPLSI